MLVTISADAARLVRRTPSLLSRLKVATATAIREGHLIGGRWQFRIAPDEATLLRASLHVEADARRSSDAVTARLLDGAAADITAANLFAGQQER
jgi:hypothetical protein